MAEDNKKNGQDEQIFSGHVYLFFSFDIGDDIDLESLKSSQAVHTLSRDLPNYLKSYHKPLTVEVPTATTGTKALYANIHHFGAISIVYEIPFKGTLTALRNKLNSVNDEYQEQSVDDIHHLFKKIEKFIVQPKFFHHRNSYLVAHIDPSQDIDAHFLKKNYSITISSALCFEKKNISAFKVEDIMESATGYYRNELVVIDTDAAFVYDKEAIELLDFFELALIQELELRYFDALLDKKLDVIYDQAIQKPTLWNILPFGSKQEDQISQLSKLKVDISVITERLENSIKTGGEAYHSEIYKLLVKKLDLETWKQSVAKKLAIIRDVQTIYQDKLSSLRGTFLEILVIILIFTELIVGILK